MSKSAPKDLAKSAQLSLPGLAWSLSGLVAVLAVAAWAQSNRWHIWPINTYQFFPVLGLLAFSLMWSQYAAGWLRRGWQQPHSILHNYFETTGWAVLVLICLHPGLLIYQRFRDHAGLPPHSYESYVMPSLRWVTLLGSVCLLVFLAYEFRRVFADRPWWHYVTYLVDAAMLGIFYHSLRLGDQLRTGWYRYIWWFYGLTLIFFLVGSYYQRYQNRSAAK